MYTVHVHVCRRHRKSLDDIPILYVIVIVNLACTYICVSTFNVFMAYCYDYNYDYNVKVIGHYTNVIGRPQMPPLWALGYHQCRYGYTGTDELKKVIARTRDVGIPYVSQRSRFIT